MSTGRALTPLDRISLVMDAPQRPLDFAVLLALSPEAASLDALRAGARSARLSFPRTACRAIGGVWQDVEEPPQELDRETLGPGALDARIEAELASPIDPTLDVPLVQRLFSSRDGDVLLTRCHHAAADLLSVGLWLDHQLSVATGALPPRDSVGEFSHLGLRSHPAPVRKSRFSHAGPSRRLWTRGPASRERRFRTVSLDAARVRARLSTVAPGFTYNDLLGASVLRALRAHQVRSAAPETKLSLWFPIDVRAEPFSGFGNGASRIRVYDLLPSGAPMLERCRSFREQVSWSKAHGEWFVPQTHPLFSLPAPLLRAYFRRPWVDMGSALFSHAERLASDPAASDRRLPGVGSVTVIGVLDRLHPLGFAALTLRGTTHLTVTWDPAQLSDPDLELLLGDVLAFVAEGEEALARCAA